jgi:hypothetical protein
MTMDPSTGEGFDAVPVGESEYFDPNATDPKFPGVLGLWMKKTTYWQGDVQFDTFDATKVDTAQSIVVSGPGGTTERGIQAGFPAGGIDSQGNPLQPDLPPGSTNAGTNTRGTWLVPGGVRTQLGFHDPTPCFEEDGVTPTLSESGSYVDITLLGAYGGDIKFPVMPEEIGGDFTHEYWTPRIVNIGEVVMPGGDSMETISWDSFFPAHYDSDYVTVAPTDLEDPKNITARIIWTMRYKMDCQLIVGGTIWNERVVITNFTWRAKAGEIGDIYYHIAFKRYRAPVITTVPNPDALWDRWYKDPRSPQNATGGQDNKVPTSSDSLTDPLGTRGTVDPNLNMVPVVPDPPATVAFDEGPAIAERNLLVTIESTTVQNSVYRLSRQLSSDEVEIAPPAPGTVSRQTGETLREVSERVSQLGPNDLQSLLKINQWVTDNGYDPYTTELPLGAGVRYYKETPVTVSNPLITIRPNIGAPVTDPNTGQTIFPRGEQADFPGVQQSRDPQIRPAYIR